MLRQDEEVCVECFCTYLTSRLGNVVRKERGENPPECYLTIKGTKYAVEVTTIMDRISTGPNSVERVKLLASFQKLIDEVKEKAQSEGNLNGFYSVFLTRPLKTLKLSRRTIKKRLLKYVERTKFAETEAPEDVFTEQGSSCTIQKWQSIPSDIGVGGPFILKWEGEYKLELISLLQERITHKTVWLAQIKLPKILLLMNRNPFVGRKDFVECRGEVTGLDKFHTIFVVLNEQEGFLLFPNNPQW